MTCEIRSGTCEDCSTISKKCKNGEIMLNGGCEASVALVGSFPRSDTEWVCSIAHGDNTRLSVYVNCCE